MLVMVALGFPGGSEGKESACSAGDMRSIPRLERSLGKGKGYPLQYSCVENLTDRGASQMSKGSQRVGHNWATNTFTFHVQFSRLVTSSKHNL